MKNRILSKILIFSLSTVLLMNGCTSASAPDAVATARPTNTLEASMPLPTDVPETISKVKKPAFLPKGYVFESTTVEETTQSVCLQYRYAAEYGDGVLFIAQGPLASTPALELVPGWPEYAILKESVQIGGAENSFHISGWRRNAWACVQAAKNEKTNFSFAMAPRYTWEFDNQQFDLYSVSAGCGEAGALTNLDLLRIAEGLTGNSTHPTDELDPECLHSVADAEKMAGFNIKEPAYLPEDVLFSFATYEKTPNPTVSLHFSIFLNDTIGSDYSGDSSIFFKLVIQTKDPYAFVKSCADSSYFSCEILQIGSTPVAYQSSDSKEQLDWQVNGFFFSLIRTAGEPGKFYKDELLKVVEGMQ